MFARIKKSGKYEYLQIVENRKIKGKVVQRVIATLGRMDHLEQKERNPFCSETHQGSDRRGHIFCTKRPFHRP